MALDAGFGLDDSSGNGFYEGLVIVSDLVGIAIGELDHGSVEGIASTEIRADCDRIA